MLSGGLLSHHVAESRRTVWSHCRGRPLTQKFPEGRIMKKVLAIGSICTIPDTNITIKTTLYNHGGVVFNHFESIQPEDFGDEG